MTPREIPLDVLASACKGRARWLVVQDSDGIALAVPRLRVKRALASLRRVQFVRAVVRTDGLSIEWPRGVLRFYLQHPLIEYRHRKSLPERHPARLPDAFVR